MQVDLHLATLVHMSLCEVKPSCDHSHLTSTDCSQTISHHHIHLCTENECCCIDMKTHANHPSSNHNLDLLTSGFNAHLGSCHGQYRCRLYHWQLEPFSSKHFPFRAWTNKYTKNLHKQVKIVIVLTVLQTIYDATFLSYHTLLYLQYLSLLMN